MYHDSNRINFIVDACLMGKETGYKALFKEFFVFGKSICQRHCSNKEDAEEILDDIFVKVFKNLSKYDQSKPFQAWFRTIAVNTCIDFYRGKSQLMFDNNENNEQIINTDENVIDKYGYDELLGFIHALPTNYRTIFLLFVMEGYSHKEIAERLNINEITSRTSLNKARVILQKVIMEKNK